MRAHSAHWRTGSTKHMRGRGTFLLQHLSQKHFPHLRQWCWAWENVLFVYRITWWSSYIKHPPTQQPEVSQLWNIHTEGAGQQPRGKWQLTAVVVGRTLWRLNPESGVQYEMHCKLLLALTTRLWSRPMRHWKDFTQSAVNPFLASLTIKMEKNSF